MRRDLVCLGPRIQQGRLDLIKVDPSRIERLVRTKTEDLKPSEEQRKHSLSITQRGAGISTTDGARVQSVIL